MDEHHARSGHHDADEQPGSQVSPVWCIAANVVQERSYGEQHEIRKGTKHFASGAKVHCVQFNWDAEFTRVEVVGRHRKSRRYIKIWMRPAHLTNWRIELIYSPTIIEHLTNYASWHRFTQVAEDEYLHEEFFRTWDGSAESKARAEEIIKVLSKYIELKTQPFNTREKHDLES